MDGKLRNMTSVYISAGDQMLMLYRIGSRIVGPSWCGIGGHFEKEELNDAKTAMLRELREEIGLLETDLANIRFKYITLRCKNSEIRMNYYFFAELGEHTKVRSDCGEGILEWVDTASVLNREMPYTAKHVLRHYLETGQYSDAVYCGAAHAGGVSFTELEEF